MTQPFRIDGSQLKQDDVALYRRLIRDVCFLYHELSAYRHIMATLIMQMTIHLNTGRC